MKPKGTTPGGGSGRRPIVVANWKMYLTAAEAVTRVQQLLTESLPDRVDLVMCPSTTALAGIGQRLAGHTIQLGAQDVFWAAPGPHTGEVSAADLRSLGVRYVLVGHSEHRASAHEHNDVVHRKALAALGHGLSPIVCVGESREDRHQHRHHHVITQQLDAAIRNLPPPDERQELLVAYEPIWAIGTGQPATAADAQEMADVIHRSLLEVFGRDVVARRTRVLYGGSVTPANVGEFVEGQSVHGVLVGTAGLPAAGLGSIVRAVASR
ncbi:MAG: triose-phosphate isomerase [Candidatus Kerfeldbacteria bacterium]|nr:triose-phosphate isomerase [Candidatus Kerfeldbacteria bacterium]